jgi:1-deoxy-D-xylulose-5-phosphate reductoisomerase
MRNDLSGLTSRNVVILGSTGSIGRQALEVCAAFPDRFRALALAAGSNVDALAGQVEAHAPSLAVLMDEERAKDLRTRVDGRRTRVLHGMEGLKAVAGLPEAHVVVSAMVGMAGLTPVLEAARCGKIIALANKEALVVGGELLTGAVRDGGGLLLPVDSEHSAVFQALRGEEGNPVSRIILTSSGGPFRGHSREDLKRATVRDALNHPTWRMGSKITIDSATLMNKGLEILEAGHLFDLPLERIEVLIHPQSIIHSLVEFEDGSVIAQMSPPDMRLPIQYALGFPRRLPRMWKRLDLAAVGQLTFESPREDVFPCLCLARRAGAAGGTMPAVMNAANEVLVDAFLRERIPFLMIPALIEKVMDAHIPVSHPGLEDLIEADLWARDSARKMCGE